MDADICVIGAGPAGSMIARRLAALGHDTLLVGRTPQAPSPRAESLAPAIGPILDSTGLRHVVDGAVFHAETRGLLLWGSAAVEERSHDGAPSLLVERGLFDRLLRDASHSAGVRGLDRVNARAPRRAPSGGWIVPVATSDGPACIRSKYLVDARGKRRRAGVHDGAPRTVALSASFIPAFLDETRIEAGADEWFWGSPVPGCRYAVTIFLDSQRVAGLGRDRRAALFRDLLSRSKLLADVALGEMDDEVCVRDATGGIAEDLVGDDFIRVGEAAVAIDPLSSQGIQRALLSAIQASAVVHTIVRGHDPVPAVEFYRERQHTAAARARDHAARLYAARGGEASAFWTRRSVGAGAAAEPHRKSPPALAGNMRLRPSPALRTLRVPVLSGMLIARAPALSHPGLEQPVAYAGGVALARLIGHATAGVTRDELLRRWSEEIAPSTARSIMQWMWAVGILVPHAASEMAPSPHPQPA